MTGHGELPIGRRRGGAGSPRGSNLAFVAAEAIVDTDVEIGPGAVILGSDAKTGIVTVVQKGAVIGANATIVGGSRIGYSSVIAPGAVVTKSVPPFAMVSGNPATVVGYQSELPSARTVGTQPIGRPLDLGPEIGSNLDLGVGGCCLFRLRSFSDVRGYLHPLEFGSDIPFLPRRAFLVRGVDSGDVRGEHAHRACRQFLIAAHGSLSVLLDDGMNRCEVGLSDPTVGLDLMPMVWATQYKFSRDAVLLVLASHAYDAEDYIRVYEDFRDEIA